MSNTKSRSELSDAAGLEDECLDVHGKKCRTFRHSLSSAFVGWPDTSFVTGWHVALMTKLKQIGQRVKQLRKDAGIKSQEELATTIGITRSTIAGIEAGTDRGGILTMIAIADHFKVPLDWLICRKAPAGGPLVGQFVDDVDELAWLNFWKELDDADRPAVLRALRIDGPGRVAK